MITARVPRTVCPEHGVKRATVPWAREGSGFTLLFEQAAMVLVREMPVLAAARIIAINDKRLWRIVEHYVAKALEGLVLSDLTAVAFDETASKKGHNYVTVFIDADRETPIGGHERLVPGGPRPRQGLPQHRHLHHHDLPDRSAARRSVRIHLIRRRAKKVGWHLCGAPARDVFWQHQFWETDLIIIGLSADKPSPQVADFAAPVSRPASAHPITSDRRDPSRSRNLYGN